MSHNPYIFAITYLSHFSNSFDLTHAQALKHVFCYLQQLEDYVICHDKAKVIIGETPKGYCDADWGNLIPERQSISGNIFTFSVGGPIS